MRTSSPGEGDVSMAGSAGWRMAGIVHARRLYGHGASMAGSAGWRMAGIVHARRLYGHGARQEPPEPRCAPVTSGYATTLRAHATDSGRICAPCATSRGRENGVLPAAVERLSPDHCGVGMSSDGSL
ncbi:hypothetical protein GCM10022229_17840 [Luteimonas lutimaris]|uniref:Uncharacterized protein n=1 Tax=Luteimonas lutimaris TaxID=698645 RepID=A0ABP7MKG0_9GAMM